MQIELEAKPSYGMAVVTLDSGESITAESGAMVAMSPDVKVSHAVDVVLGAVRSARGSGRGLLCGLVGGLLAYVRRKNIHLKKNGFAKIGNHTPPYPPLILGVSPD